MDRNELYADYVGKIRALIEMLNENKITQKYFNEKIAEYTEEIQRKLESEMYG
jgi:hypothetical protein